MGTGGGGTDYKDSDCSLEKVVYDNMTIAEKAKFLLIPGSCLKFARLKDKMGMLNGPTGMMTEYAISLGEEALRLGCYSAFAYYVYHAVKFFSN